mmetsp:Transcript_24477/g.41915  ORF Transcript_24477/g.41915 Transcript_24477/m.41915 type:complete len:201 (+) Transcript_24477:749-1351(+)
MVIISVLKNKGRILKSNEPFVLFSRHDFMEDFHPYRRIALLDHIHISNTVTTAIIFENMRACNTISIALAYLHFNILREALDAEGMRTRWQCQGEALLNSFLAANGTGDGILIEQGSFDHRVVLDEILFWIQVFVIRSTLVIVVGFFEEGAFLAIAIRTGHFVDRMLILSRIIDSILVCLALSLGKCQFSTRTRATYNKK